jgi:hypothetical protein
MGLAAETGRWERAGLGLELVFLFREFTPEERFAVKRYNIINA